MDKIETFVFFDLETTGLPSQEENKTKIVELCFLAVSRKDIERASAGTKVSSQKLTLLFNPERDMQPKAEELTGLTRDFLSNAPVFGQMIDIILTFLDKLPQPSCLVAHNGDTFDYEIFLAEFVDASVELPKHLWCVDSLKGFRSILHPPIRSYSLPNLYLSLRGSAIVDAHRAEGDCNALLECVIVKKEFMEWTDKNRKPLTDIEPLDRNNMKKRRRF